MSTGRCPLCFVLTDCVVNVSLAACDCYNGGALNGACDYVTGQCTCKPNVATAQLVGTSGLAGDRKCSECRQNFYGIGRGTGCLPCECHVTGSTSQQCEENGQCPCVETVQDLRCDECKPGFFGFGSMGCRWEGGVYHLNDCLRMLLMILTIIIMCHWIPIDQSPLGVRQYLQCLDLYNTCT